MAILSSGGAAALFLKGNWKWLLGAAGCAVLGGMLAWEKWDHAVTSRDLARTETELVASEAQYQAAESGRQKLKTALGRVQSALVAAEKRGQEAQTLAERAIQRGSGRARELETELARLRQAAPAEPALDCPAAQDLAKEIWE